MADEARLNELLDLVEQARNEGDKDTEAKAVAAYKRESAPQPFPDSYGGAGGYNPMLANLGGATSAVAGGLGLTPENTANPIANAFGPAEMAAHLATGGVGQIAGGLAGIGQGAWNLLTPKSMNGPDAADRLAQVSNALTYDPRTGAGAGMTKVVGAPGELYGKGTNYLGEKTTDITGSPLAGALVKTAGDIAPALLSDGEVRAGKGKKPTGEYAPSKDVVPTSGQLEKASDAHYKASDAVGVVIKPEATQRVITMIQGVADSENLGKLPPKIKEASDILADRIKDNKPLSLRDADKVRQLIGDAQKSTDAADRRLATGIKGQYDDYLENLSPQDTLAGNTEQGLALLTEARDLFRRRRNSEMVDDMEHEAARKGEGKYTQAGVEHALRQEFEKLARDDKRMRYLTPEQRAAVERVVAPGKKANTLRNIGKFDPAKGGMGATLGGAVGGGAGAALGALAGVATGGAIAGPLVLGGAAHLAARLARKGTQERVTAARESLVGRGLPGMRSEGLLAKEAPVYDSVPFKPTGGVIPARAAASRGLELAPDPVANPQALPPVPSRLIASAPPSLQGGIPFTRSRLPIDTGDLQLEQPRQRYPGSVEFTPSNPPPMAPQMAGRLGLLADETPAIPATAQKGLLDLPRAPALRPSKEIQADIRRLSETAKKLTPEQLADPAYTAGISQELARLRSELEASQVSRRP